MNQGQHIGFGMNVLGLILFLAWFLVRNHLSTTLSIVFAFLFLGLLLTSIFIMIKASQQGKQG